MQKLVCLNMTLYRVGAGKKKNRLIDQFCWEAMYQSTQTNVDR